MYQSANLVPAYQRELIPLSYAATTLRYRYFKRAIDLIAATVLLLMLSPLFLLVAILVKMTSDGPALYRYPVVGAQGRIFTSYKFRSMAKDAEARKQQLMTANEMSGPVFKLRRDPRVTPLGRFLRKYSIDELPQLWLVLTGELSLVGPRAPGPHEFAGFEPWQWRKLSVKPGITCLWQVRGRNSISDFDRWVRLDLSYIDNWSVGLDLQILWGTIAVVLRGTGY